MSNLIPGEEIQYRMEDKVVWCSYPNRPDVDPWIAGGDPAAVARAKGEIELSEMREIFVLAQTHSILKSQLDKLYTTYILIRDGRETNP